MIEFAPLLLLVIPFLFVWWIHRESSVRVDGIVRRVKARGHVRITFDTEGRPIQTWIPGGSDA